jgi:2-(1,2-epoxy-1,2-dihydrophenyl)acetyl-CoA isomerase
MSDDIRVDDREGIRRIVIARPSSRNGLTLDTNQAMIDAFRASRESDAIRVIVLSGADGHFCSGLDLKEAVRRGPVPAEQMRADIDTYFHCLIRAVRDAPVPTIAAVDGMAAGFGFDLALACDIRIASERARFGEIFVRRALVPDGGGTFMLPRIVGLARALELMYTGDIIDAETAREIGLCNHVYRLDEFEDQVWNLASRLAQGPPLSLRLIKQSVYAALDGTLDQALEREREAQLRCLESRDFAEGVSAFFGKREPRFTGK